MAVSEAPASERIVRSSSDLTIERVRLRELVDYAEHTASATPADQELPITPHLARAQASNPYADPDDIALLVGRSGRNCAAYLGLLPGRLRIGDRIARVHWATGWGVAPGFGGHGYGRRLLAAALAEPIDFLSTGNSDAAERSFRRAGLRELGPFAFRVIYLQKSLAERAWKRIRRDVLSKPADRLSVVPEFTLSRPTGRGKLILRETAELSEDAERLLASTRPEVVFERGVDAIHWTVRCPWVHADGCAPPENYRFAMVRDAFRCGLLEAHDRDTGQFAGFLAFAASTQNNLLMLKLLDYCFDREAQATAGRALLQLARLVRGDGLVLSDVCAAPLRPLLSCGSVEHKRQRGYFWHPGGADSPLARVADRVALSLCDGDTAFT